MSPLQTKIDGCDVSVGDEIIRRYDSNLPRYTSYPPAPLWHSLSPSSHKDAIFTFFRSEDANNKEQKASLYLHIPFCDHKCRFCGCNSIATTDHDIKMRYMSTCSKEIEMIGGLCEMTISKIHLGGGTPSSVGIDPLKKIVDDIRKRFHVVANAELGIELDPRTISEADISKLKDAGFTRLSFGVQDFDPAVGVACGRVSDVEHIWGLVNASRKIGVEGINFDLIYGLPMQNLSGWKKTILSVIEMKPDRIAVFNFAYLPQSLKNQSSISAESLPDTTTKLKILTSAIELLTLAGYTFIGLDHFAREGDELDSALKNGSITRTFQGYASGEGLPVIGIGASAISEIGNVYSQNEKNLTGYMTAIEAGNLATSRGITLDHSDEMRRWAIRKLLCSLKIDKNAFEKKWSSKLDAIFPDIAEKIAPLKKDGLVDEDASTLRLTPKGRLFARHAAAIFDPHLNHSMAGYSRSI